MAELIQDTVDTSSISFDAASVINEPPKTEEITTALLQKGFELNSPDALQVTKEVQDQQAIGDTSFVTMAKFEKETQDRQDIINKAMSGEDVDLVKLDVALDQYQLSVPEWQAAVASGLAIGSEGIEVQTEEQAELINKTLKDLTAFSVKQTAINQSQAAIDVAFDEYTWGEILGDVALSIVEPHAETVTLANVTAELTGEANITGYLLPTGSINNLADKLADMPIDEAAALIQDIVDRSIDRQNQFGVGQNKATNLYIAQTLLNTVNENRSQEGFLGIKNVGDGALDVLAILDISGVGAVGRVGKSVYKKIVLKLFGKADSIPVKAVESIAVKVATPLKPNLDVVSKRGSLGDTLEKAKPDSIGDIIKKSPPEQLDETLDAVGLDNKAIQERSSGSISGTIDPVSLPPSATNAKLKGLVETVQGGFDVNLLGGAANRSKIMAEFHKEFVEVTQGFPHPSKSFVRPPKEGDNISLGTSVIRFGKNADEGFNDLEDAQFLMQIYKALGESVDIVQGNGKAWVEVSRRHVLSEADAGVFSNVTGQRLATPAHVLTKWFMPWSRSIKNVADGMHPQAMDSWARDLGSVVKRELQDIAKPFFEAQRKIDKTDYNLASKALMEGEKEQAVYNTKQLRTRYPEISDTAIEAYHSYRAAVDGIQLMRSVEFGKKLSRGGYKQIDIGTTQLFGSVITQKPVVGKLVTNEKGEHLVDNLIQGKTLEGDQIYDAVNNTTVTLTQELIDHVYSSGGRVIRLSSKFEAGDAGSFSHIIVKNIDDVAISEIPLYPAFGKKGYAVERFYDDAGIVIEQVGAKRKLNGVDGVGRQGVGVVANIAEAKALIKHLQRKHPEEQFEWKQSRELDNLLEETAGGNGGPSWIKKRQDEVLLGKLDANGLPTDGNTLNIAEAFSRSIQNTGSLPLQQTAGILKQRWMNQFGNFLSPSAKVEGSMPKILNGDSWDNQAIKDAGLDFATLKNDAKTFHHNIISMEHQAAGPIIRAKRVWLAGLARSFGANEGLVSQLASKSLTKLNTTNPAVQLRHVTALLNIGYGVAYQVPQNAIGAFSIMASQGIDGLRAMKDMLRLNHGLRMLGKGADEDLAFDAVAKSLGIPKEEAVNYIKRFKQSGIQGSASDLDNVLTYSISSGKLGFSPIKTINNKISGVVGKSIDVTNMGFWTAAHRQVRKDFLTNKKNTNSQDFWEAVRNKTREFGQNQNKSDLLAFERENNLLAFGLQFSQHLMKLGQEGVAIVGKGLGFKTNSVLAKNQAQALRAVGIYFGIFGASGMGNTGMQFMNEQLPDFLANPQNEVDRNISNFILGGMLDLLVNVGTEGNISISSGTSAGGAVDIYNGYLDVIRKSHAAGKLELDMVDVLGGASMSTFSKIGRVFRGLPSIIEIDEQLDEGTALETITFIGEALGTTTGDVVRTTKLGGDLYLAYAQAIFEARFSKNTGKVSGNATLKEAIGKAFGMGSRGEVINRGDNKTSYLMKLNIDAIAKQAKADGLVDFFIMVNPDNPKSLDLWRDKQRKRANALALTIPDSEQAKFKTAMFNHALQVLQGDKGMRNVLERMTPIVGFEQALEQYKRHPDTPSDQVEQVEILFKVLEDNRKQQQENK